MNPDPEVRCQKCKCGCDWTLDFNTKAMIVVCPGCGETETAGELDDMTMLRIMARNQLHGYGTLIQKTP